VAARAAARAAGGGAARAAAKAAAGGPGELTGLLGASRLARGGSAALPAAPPVSVVAAAAAASTAPFVPASCEGLVPAFLGVCVCPPDVSLVFEWCSAGTLREFLDACAAPAPRKSGVAPLPPPAAAGTEEAPSVVKYVPVGASRWRDGAPPAGWEDEVEPEAAAFVPGRAVLEPVAFDDGEEGAGEEGDRGGVESGRGGGGGGSGGGGSGGERSACGSVAAANLRALRATLWVVGAAPDDADRFPPSDWRAWDVSDVGALARCWSGGADAEAVAGAAGEPPAFLQRLAFGLQAARGLAFLHAFEPPLLHRDVKSTNLMLTHTERGAASAAAVGAEGVGRAALEAQFPLSARLGESEEERAESRGRGGERGPGVKGRAGEQGQGGSARGRRGRGSTRKRARRARWRARARRARALAPTSVGALLTFPPHHACPLPPLPFPQATLATRARCARARARP